jgi:alkylation response protein AidB-like acyl-CoA dehydrogenase
MNFGLNEQQKLIKDGARDYLRRTCDGAYVRSMRNHATGCSEQVWRDIVAMGWTGLAVPERYGGAGLGLIELALVLEQMGAVALPGPFLTSAIGAIALSGAGSDHQQQTYLPRIVDGTLILTLAAQDAEGVWPFVRPCCVATRAGRGWKISGRTAFVQDPPASGLLLVAASVESQERGHAAPDVLLCLIPRDASGVKVGEPSETVANDRQSVVAFEGVTVDDAAVLGNPESGAQNLRRLFLTGAALKSVEMAGGAGRVLEMTVEYAKTRQQFGRSIGSFQAVQHMIAEMAIQAESARQLAYQAVSRLEAGKAAHADTDVALAKLWANEACVRVCELAHQCHGAIGFTEEHDLQLFTRRALAGRVKFGDDRDHRDAALSSIGL